MRSIREKSNQPKKATSAGTNQTLYRGGLRHRSVSSSEAAREEHLSGGVTVGPDCFQFPSMASTLPNVEDEGPSSGGGAMSVSHRRTPTSGFSHVLKVNIAALFVHFLCIFLNSTKILLKGSNGWKGRSTDFIKKEGKIHTTTHNVRHSHTGQSF